MAPSKTIQRVLLPLVLMATVDCLIKLPVNAAQLPPHYTDWEYWYYSGWPGGQNYASESQAKAAITMGFEQAYGCPASLQTTGIWYWGDYSVYEHPAAYLSHGDHDYKLHYANNPPACDDHVSRDVTLRKQRIVTPPVCNAGYNGPFEIEPGGPWYACRDDEQNFFENPLTPDCAPTAGNPCELTTGAKVEKVVDYSGPGVKFYRTFRSNFLANVTAENWPIAHPPYGVMGGNWMHNYAAAIIFEASPFAVTHLLRPDGTLVKLLEVEPGVLVAENGSGLQVRGIGALEYGSDIVVYLPTGAKEIYKWHRFSTMGSLRPYLKELHDPLGNVTTVHYRFDALGLEIGDVITSVVGPFGHTLQFEHASVYVPFGQSKFSLDYLLDPAGQKIDFVHDQNDPATAGNWLEGVIYPDQASVDYRYEDPTPGWGVPSDYYVRGIIDEHGHEFATFEYYDVETSQLDQRVKSTRHGAFEYTEFAYAYTGESATVTDALGNATVYQFQASPGTDPHAAVPNWVARNPGVVGYPGGATSIQVNESGGQRRYVEGIDENGVLVRYVYDDYHMTMKQEGYDANAGRFLRETHYEYLNSTSDLKTRVRTASVACPGKWRVTVTTYHPGTQWVTSETDIGYAPGDCSNPVSRTTRYADFNAFGQPRQIEGPRGVEIVSVEYFECQTGGECGQIRSVTNALGHVTQYPDYDAHGRLTRAIDPNGITTLLSYTPRGLIRTIAREYGAQTRLIEFDYDAAGLLDFVRLPEGVTFDYRWNEAHLLESVINSAGDRIEYAYDARGQRISERLVDSALFTRKSVSLEYNARNLLSAVGVGVNPATVIDYDAAGNRTAMTDPNANGTYFQYDPLNRLIRMIDPVSGPAMPTDYRYDAHDNVEYVSTPNGAETTYSFDDLGNLLREHSPDRGLTLYGYDAAGNLTCKSDARVANGVDYSNCAAARSSGAAWVYTYDALNRVDTIDYLDTPAVPDVDYDYDSGPIHLGRLTSVLNSTGAGQTVLTDYQYDVWGNRTAQIEVAPGRSGTVTNSVAFEYDGNDQLTRMTYPNGRVVDYARTNGRITSVTTDSPFDGATTTLVDFVNYVPFGPAGNIHYGNGLTNYRALDTAYRPIHFILTNPDGMVDLQAYSLDFAGNVLSIEDQFEPVDSLSFEYDALNRLVDDSRVDGDASVATYAYDQNGNRLARHADRSGYDDQSITLVGASNLQSSVNSTPVVYDAAGNVLENGSGLRAFYDSANRLSSLNQGGTSTTHLYNGAGALAKLVRRSNCGCSCQHTHEYFAFAPDGRALTHYSENRVRFSTDYVWLDGIPIAAIEERFGSDGTHQAGSTVITYLHADHLGSPVLGTDRTGVVVWENTPDAFGRAIISTAGPDIRLRFPGQFDLGVGGIHYNYYRNYDSNTGRYLETDPIGLRSGINTYAYADNNPLRFIDPFGLERLEVSISGSIPFFGEFELGLLVTDGQGDLGCRVDLGVFLDIGKPIAGATIQSGIGKLKLGPSITYARNLGRGAASEVDAKLFVGVSGLGVGIGGLAHSDIPESYTIEGGVVVAAGASQNIQLSLSVGDLARLAAGIASADFSQRILGVDPSSDSCGCGR